MTDKSLIAILLIFFGNIVLLLGVYVSQIQTLNADQTMLIYPYIQYAFQLLLVGILLIEAGIIVMFYPQKKQ